MARDPVTSSVEPLDATRAALAMDRPRAALALLAAALFALALWLAWSLEARLALQPAASAAPGGPRERPRTESPAALVLRAARPHAPGR